MPIYEYRCENGHTFEVMQRMTDDPLTSCSTCEAPVQRVFHPVAVHFKGSGFYSTDYAKNQPKGSDEGKSTTGSDDSGKGSDTAKGSADTAKSSSSNSDGSEAKSKAGSSESKSSKS